ncbi:MAG: leucine-rich repeat domain-containing protein [Candidatus Thorarchaeota archaeon]|nr:leucine-rich repeat domain-containing protein [Candidatus Thorarchaeota archaeon]
MSDKYMLVVRCAKAPAKNYHFIFKTFADNGSEFFERKSDLKWVEEIDQPVRIDISSNWLTEVDLTPLESCKDLEYLSLGVNKLETVDLTPLQSCKHLKHLDLSHNRFRELDLTPLAGCEELVYLYLQENQFRRINIAPLYQLEHLTTAVIQLTHQGPRPKVVIDSFMSNRPPNLNDSLFAFFTNRVANLVPDWLYDKDAEIDFVPKSYKDLVSKFGWKLVKKHLLALAKKLPTATEFAAQGVLLEAFAMRELACYDGPIYDIVRLLPLSGSYETGRLQLYSKMVNLLDAQLTRGGSTLYFNLDLLSTTPGSVLLPAVLSRRDAEMQDVVLFDRSGKVDLLPLWLTSYGNKILSVLGVKRYVPASMLSKINNALNEINHDISVEKVVYDARRKKVQKFATGRAILSHVRQAVA